jgi:hypothetical protein
MKNYNELFREKLLKIIDELDDSEKIRIYNEVKESENYFDDLIYSMDDFDEINNHLTAWEVARACFYGDFRPCDHYWNYDGYGNFRSFDFLSDKIDADEIADYIEENEESFYICEIEELFEEYEESNG